MVTAHRPHLLGIEPQWRRAGWSRPPRSGRERKLLAAGKPQPGAERTPDCPHRRLRVLFHAARVAEAERQETGYRESPSRRAWRRRNRDRLNEYRKAWREKAAERVAAG